MFGAISLCRKRDGFLVSLALSHHGPGHSGKLVGKRNGGDLGRSPGQQCREPGAVFGAVDLGIADDGECTGDEQAAQIAVTLFADAAEPILPCARVLLRYEPDPGRDIRQLCCSGVLVGTNRMLALATASQMASASAASFFCRLT